MHERNKSSELQLLLRSVLKEGYLLRMYQVPPENASAARVLFPRRSRENMGQVFRALCQACE